MKIDLSAATVATTFEDIATGEQLDDVVLINYGGDTILVEMCCEYGDRYMIFGQTLDFDGSILCQDDEHQLHSADAKVYSLRRVVAR